MPHGQGEEALNLDLFVAAVSSETSRLLPEDFDSKLRNLRSIIVAMNELVLWIAITPNVVAHGIPAHNQGVSRWPVSGLINWQKPT
jgi:hypothetical protein